MNTDFLEFCLTKKIVLDKTCRTTTINNLDKTINNTVVIHRKFPEFFSLNNSKSEDCEGYRLKLMRN